MASILEWISVSAWVVYFFGLERTLMPGKVLICMVSWAILASLIEVWTEIRIPLSIPLAMGILTYWMLVKFNIINHWANDARNSEQMKHMLNAEVERMMNRRMSQINQFIGRVRPEENVIRVDGRLHIAPKSLSSWGEK